MPAISCCRRARRSAPTKPTARSSRPSVITLEARNLERKPEAEQVATKLAGKQFVVVRQAGETGQLYGSVTTRDLAEIIEAGGFTVERSQVALNQPIKTIGMHEVSIALHPEVDTRITVNVARSEDEAARQARGEDVTLANRGDDDEQPAAPAPEELLEPGALPPKPRAKVPIHRKTPPSRPKSLEAAPQSGLALQY